MSEQGRLVAGRYRLVQRVGRGGMGTVWRAEDELLGRQVAVKVLHVPPHVPDDTFRMLHERTRREARSAARIAHPHVIVVHDVVEDEGLPCIVMEYVPSITLEDALEQRGALPTAEAARIGLAVVEALRAAHDMGVWHRDVKPANILLGQDGRIVLTDFGIAAVSGTETLTRTGELVGSLAYLAPERLRGGDAGAAGDLWSLGVTLYRAVEGRHPFDREAPIETAYAVVSDPHTPPADGSILASLIDGLLVKEPEQRTGLTEAERLLRRAAKGGSAGHGTSSSPLHRAARPGRRVRGGLLWSGAAALAAAGAVTAALLWPGALFGDGSAHSSGGRGSTAAPSPPDGYRLQDGGGVTLPVPTGWSRDELAGGEIAFVDPSGLLGLRVKADAFAGADALEHWRTTEEEQTRRDNPGYERVRMTASTVHGRPAGYWEFTFNGKVRKFRAVEVAFADNAGTQYVVYFSAPDAEWDQHRPVFDTAVEGLRLPT
ncbi:serine/threonine-protein kinase [Streptomyces virginiae]|uniref:non-specific serine/threonine protein kinase n=1 Tax=Streptomyces virginiae TaxID=1961 RepID=A0ABZ1TLI9_STRVG|nr:serine/threonine-protein kinase [Streptomyces virginiae]